MSELPQGWEQAPLKSVVLLNEKFKDIDDDMECGFVPMNLVPLNLLDSLKFEPKVWKDCRKGYTHFKDGDVLLAKITPCFENGKSALVTGLPNGIGAGSTEYFVLRGELVSAKYIHAFVKTKRFMTDCTVRMSGSVGHKRVPKDYLLEYPIPVAPLKEQIRIVNKLDSLLAKVDKAQARLEKIPTLLKRFRQSVLAAATSGALTREWRGKNGLSLKDWEKFKFNELLSGLRSGAGDKPSDEPKGIPVLRSSAVRDMHIDYSDARYFNTSTKLREANNLKDGDLLFTRLSGSAEYVGNCALVSGLGTKNIQFPDRLFCATPNNIELSPFLEIYFSSAMFKRYIFSQIKSSAGHQRITLEVIKKAEVTLPGIEEQKEIVRRVESLFALADSVEKQYQAAKFRMDRLTQSILAKAFKGELVPQDSSDEPASELLKRIQMERKIQKAKPKAKTTKKRAPSKKTKVTAMKLSETPSNYLLKLLEEMGGEAYAEVLWEKSELDIDDFYAKLKTELISSRIVDDNTSPDPSLRKLKIAS